MPTNPTDPQTIKALIAAFDTSDSCSLIDAQTALVAMGPPAIGPLIAALEADNPKIAALAAQTLGKLGATEALGGLIAALDAFEWPVREQAALALGRLGQRAAILPLENALHDPVSAVGRAIRHALHQLVPPTNP